MYYQGYELAKEYMSLNEEEVHVLYACHWMVENRSSIRETARNCDYSATTFWRRIHKECRKLSPELYWCIIRQMKENVEENRRGIYGKSR